MNKLNLAITSEEQTAQVHLNASFEDKATAIAFHAKVAALCQSVEGIKSGLPYQARWPMRLLGRG